MDNEQKAQVTAGKKWTKKDLASLKAALAHWWLFNKMYLRPGLTCANVFARMPLEERQRIVVGQFKGDANMFEERALEHCGHRMTHEHAKANPHIWGDSTAEIIERFQRLERETLAAAAKLRALAERVESEGLPAEVVEFVPE